MAKILLIDDDREMLDMLRLLLERRGGHETILSSDGEEGLAKAREDAPDLAIIDVMMPGMTGYEVCRRLRESPETASMPILILTARGQAVDRVAALDAGADEHIAKPVPVAELLAKVNGLLEQYVASGRSRVVVLFGLRGGVGVTTLAVNLAATLFREHRGSVCVVDLCPSSGHVALQFGMRPEPSWLDLVESGVPGAQAVEALLLEHPSGIHLLASPIVPLVGRRLSRSTAEKVLRTLQERFDILVVDTPLLLDQATMAALDAATDTWLVMAAEPASIQTVLGISRALGQRAEEFSVILNQAAREHRVSPAAIERVLKRPLGGDIPFDPRQAQALARGEPLALGKPDSLLATAMGQLAKRLI
jgi:CheY-like chemotaxis protein